jgi:hypothetical protein
MSYYDMSEHNLLFISIPIVLKFTLKKPKK